MDFLYNETRVSSTAGDKVASPTQYQLMRAKQLGIEFPEGCDSNQAARKLDVAIASKTKKVIEANPALRVNKIIMYEGRPMKISRILDRFKLVLKPPTGGKQTIVWIIDVADCQEMPTES